MIFHWLNIARTVPVTQCTCARYGSPYVRECLDFGASNVNYIVSCMISLLKKSLKKHKKQFLTESQAY